MTRMVVGLGNPGPEYEATRHNVGFMVIDALGENLRASYWKDDSGAKVAVVRFGDQDLVLAKPQTFMNLSGKSVARLAKAYDCEPEEIVVVHDDIDLPDGVVRVKMGGGHGGHNGLRSVSEAIGSEYARVRIGVGRPPGRMCASDYVLEPLKGERLTDLEGSVPTAAQAVMHILEHGADAAMREYNQD